MFSYDLHGLWTAPTRWPGRSSPLEWRSHAASQAPEPRTPPPTSLARSTVRLVRARGLAALALCAVALAGLLVLLSDSPSAQAQTANPDGVIWQAKITPAQHNAAHLTHITGWSHNAYGSIDGSRTFTEGGATFTLNWVAHRDGTGITDSTAMLLRMTVSQSTAFGAATLCAGGVSVPLPARTAAASHDFAISGNGVTATPPWTNGVAVGVGIVRSPATCASLTSGIVWEAEITPGTSGNLGVTGFVGILVGTINGGATFTDGGVTFTFRSVIHDANAPSMAFELGTTPASATFGAATLCAGNLAVPVPESSTTSGSIASSLSHSTITAALPWTIGTPTTVALVRAPSTCDTITGGIVWQAEMTPDNYSAFPGITGWQHNTYGSIDGDRTFPDGGATFTVTGVAHSTSTSAISLGMSVSPASATFRAASLCVGGLPLSMTEQVANNGALSWTISDAAISSTPPWTTGTPVTVGIVRAPATCASIQPVAPAAVGAIPPVDLHFGGSQTIDLAPHFSGTTLTYTASSSNPAIATASVVGSTLTLQYQSAGTVTVTVTATNSEGSATQSFRVTAIGPAPGVVWQAEITPDYLSGGTDLSGWTTESPGFGSIVGGRTFTDGGATFTVDGITHLAGASQVLLSMDVSPAAAFSAATLCAGGVSVPIPARNTAGTHDFTISGSGVTATAPWIIGAPAAVGIVRSPATCASLVTAPRAAGTMPTVGLPLNASQTIDVAQYFSGSTLTFSATSSNPSVTSASIASGSSLLTIRNLSAGTVTVTVTASNPAGSVSRSFRVQSSADTLSARLNGLEDDGRLYMESGETVTVTARVNAPAGTSYTWQALSPARTPQSELTITSGASGSFPNLVTGRTISVVLQTPETVAEFYNLFLLRLTLGGLVVDTKVMVTRAEPEGRAALVTADAGEDRTVTVGSRVTLQGRAGPYGASLSTYWKQVGGRLLGTDQGFTPEFPGDFLLFNQGGLRPNFIAPNRPDVIVLRLDVEDEYGNRASDTVRITVVEEQVADTTPPKPIVITRPPDRPERPWVVPPPPLPRVLPPKGSVICPDPSTLPDNPLLRKIYTALCE